MLTDFFYELLMLFVLLYRVRFHIKITKFPEALFSHSFECEIMLIEVTNAR